MAEERTPSIGKSWTFQMPIKLREEELDPMFRYLTKRFQDSFQANGIVWDPKKISLFEEETSENKVRGIRFGYLLGRYFLVGGIPFSVIASKGRKDNLYSLNMVCRGGGDKNVYKTVDFIRMVLMEWSSTEKT